jgi:hypothetical protein
MVDRPKTPRSARFVIVFLLLYRQRRQSGGPASAPSVDVVARSRNFIPGRIAPPSFVQPIPRIPKKENPTVANGSERL